MDLNLPSVARRCLDSLCHNVKQHLRRWTRPDSQSLAVNAVLDLTRSKSELVLENALLRQQLIVLQRQVKRPTLTWRDRVLCPRSQQTTKPEDGTLDRPT
jgi:putative transposase